MMAGSGMLVRARNELEQFVGDDPATPENEAWVLVDGTTAGSQDNDTNPQAGGQE